MKRIAIALCLFVVCVAGCSIGSWDVQVKDGQHRTVWNYGLEFRVDGWGFYIGPGRNSNTVIENDFTGAADGTGSDDDASSENESPADPGKEKVSVRPPRWIDDPSTIPKATEAQAEADGAHAKATDETVPTKKVVAVAMGPPGPHTVVLVKGKNVQRITFHNGKEVSREVLPP